MSQSNQEIIHCCGVELEKTTLQNDFFFFFDLWSAHEVPIYWAFPSFQFASNAEQP